MPRKPQNPKVKVKTGGEGKAKTPRSRVAAGGKGKSTASSSQPDLRSEPKEIVPRCATFGTTDRDTGGTEEPQRPQLPREVKPRRKIDLDKAINLRLKGLSYQEIADVFHCRKESVWEALQPYVPEGTADLEAYKRNRADLLAAKGWEVLRSLTDDKINKASARDAAIVYGTLYDKERLERGQSTENVGLAVFPSVVASACKGGKTADIEAEEVRPTD